MFAKALVTRNTTPAEAENRRAVLPDGGIGGRENNPVWKSLALRPVVQPKLIRESGDPYEQEADRVADHVMNMSNQGPPIPAFAKGSDGGATLTTRPQSPAGTSGQPLDSATRAFFEPRFGQDFGDVKTHADSAASASASTVKARAFTTGADIIFGPGEQNAGSQSHLHLLAHELTHVIQQREGRSPIGIQRQPDISYVDHGATAHAMGTFDSKTRVYTVPSDKSVYPDQSKPFDTFFSIALRFGTTAQAIQELNGVTLKPGQQIKIPTAVSEAKPRQEETEQTVSQDAQVVNPAVSTDTLSSEETPNPSTSNTVPIDTSKTTTPKQIVVHKPTNTKQESLGKDAQTAATISATSRLLAYGLLHKYASFLPGTEFYLPFTLNDEGLGEALARDYVRQPAVVAAVLDLTRWTDRDDVAFQFISNISNKDLVVFDRPTLERLKAEIMDESITESETWEIYRIEVVLGLKPVTKATVKKDEVPYYKQGDKKWKDRVLGEVAKIGPKGCAVTAMSMAVSSVSGKQIDPAEMDTYLDKHSGYSGDNVYWSKAAQSGGLTAQRHVGFDIAVVDESLAVGKPCVISVNGNGHWVTVTAKRVEKGRSIYTIHDPATGKAADMELEGDALVGAKGAYSKKSGKYIITLSK